MNAQGLDSAPSASDLAWWADRTSLDALGAPVARLFENVAEELGRIWPDDDLPALDPAEKDELDELRRRDSTVTNIIGVTATDELDATIRARLERERAEGEKDATIPSRANTAERKAMRLLIEGRLDVTRHDTTGEHAGLIVATCRGDSGTVYTLGYDPRPATLDSRRWRCTCPELRGACSHLQALKLIVTATPTTTEGDRR